VFLANFFQGRKPCYYNPTIFISFRIFGPLKAHRRWHLIKFAYLYATITLLAFKFLIAFLKLSGSGRFRYVIPSLSAKVKSAQKFLVLPSSKNNFSAILLTNNI
jgi:hypothetical protein